MPARPQSHFTQEELSAAARVTPFTFTGGIPVPGRVALDDASRPPVHAGALSQVATVLRDRPGDPGQGSALDSPEVDTMPAASLWATPAADAGPAPALRRAGVPGRCPHGAPTIS